MHTLAYSQHSITPLAFKFSPTSEAPVCKTDGTKATNQISPSWSHDTFPTPPHNTSESSPPVVSMETKPHQSSKVPLKSALRRSERLRKTNMAAPSQRKVSISNLVHVSLYALCSIYTRVHVHSCIYSVHVY